MMTIRRWKNFRFFFCRLPILLALVLFHYYKLGFFYGFISAMRFLNDFTVCACVVYRRVTEGWPIEKKGKK